MLRRIRFLLATLLLGGAAFAASMPAAGQTTDVTVANDAPTILGVTPSSTTVTPVAGTTTSVTIVANFADNNGFNDIAGTALTVTRPDGSTLTSTTTPTRTNANGPNATYEWTFAIPFHEPPGVYQVIATVQDTLGASANNTASPATFTYQPLVALRLDAQALSFGAGVRPGATTATQALGVTNLGNVRIDTDISGTALQRQGGGGTIPANRLAYGLTATTANNTLTTAPATLAAFDLPPGAASTRELFWQLRVPTAAEQQIPAGTYTGTVTVAAREG